jgi:phage tail-like protein
MLNPLKQFNFDIEVAGIVQFTAQEVTTPEINVGEVEHGEGNVKKRTPGLISYGDLTVSTLKVAPNADAWAYDWFEQLRLGTTPTQYLKNVVIRLKDQGGATVRTIECIECWVKKLGGMALSQTADENVIEEVVIVVNDLVNS